MSHSQVPSIRISHIFGGKGEGEIIQPTTVANNRFWLFSFITQIHAKDGGNVFSEI